MDFNWKQNWAHEGVRKDTYSIGQYITYAATEKFFITLGHSNDGASLLNSGGTDTNIAIYDNRTSVVYGSIRAIF